jgi:glycosyltransferase involved in cell wall biosynthesis
MKKISVLIPCYNEEENVIPISQAVIDEFEKSLPNYDYEIVFIDNDSQDNTRVLIESLCANNPKIKAIFNAKNFGQFNSPYYGLTQTTGDCTILLCADFQDPVDMIPKLVYEWEQGHKIVCAIKTASKENPIMRLMRSIYYKIIKMISDVEQIEHFTGFGLYDAAFIDVLRNLDDSKPFLRGIVAEFGFRRKDIEYTQAKRRAGKTHNNFYSLYDAAMLSFTSYTKIGLRIATFLGLGVGAVSCLIGLYYLIYKLVYWDRVTLGLAPLVVGIFFVGAIQLFFLGFMGEYILNINARVMRRPLVVEERRINFDEPEKEKTDKDVQEKDGQDEQAKSEGENLKG